MRNPPREGAPFWSAFGPGVLWAATAVGVSHLVQSTRAGADAGLGLAGVIVLALVLKYPFFEYGPRYAAATGETLVEGYGRIGRWALWTFLLITLSTAFMVELAVVMFTAFLFRAALGVALPLPLVAGLVVLACAALFRAGRFRGLDLTIKVIMALLAISTLFAAALTLPRVDLSTLALWPPASAGVPFAFILALAGWMPSGVDSAVWSSAWTLAKNRDRGTTASVAHALLDFRIGYVATGVLACSFLVLGAGVMFHTGTTFSNAGTQFSLQLVDLYAHSLGDWTRPIVMVAVLTTMASTALTVIDGFPRAIARTVAVIRRTDDRADRDGGPVYWAAILVLGILTVVFIAWFAGTLTALVDFATIVSFLTAPILGYLNLRVVRSSFVPAEHRPGASMVALSWAGLVLLGGTAIVYLAGRL
jgi:Mn2+/Fe2+ NRAMP family transporter